MFKNDSSLLRPRLVLQKSKQSPSDSLYFQFQGSYINVYKLFTLHSVTQAQTQSAKHPILCCKKRKKEKKKTLTTP